MRSCRKVFGQMACGMLALSLISCGGQEQNDRGQSVSQSRQEESTILEVVRDEEPSKEVEEAIEIGYPVMDEIEYYFVNSIQYGEPVAMLGYQNNSDYTIVKLDLSFEVKEDIAEEELQLFDEIKKEEGITDEDILGWKPEVYDYMVCDSGEKVEGADVYLDYNLHPTNVKQCEVLELNYAEIYYIAEDDKIHMVMHSGENGANVLSEEYKECYEWSNSDYAQMIPKPDSRIVKVEYDKEDYFECMAYDMEYADYRAYIDTCLTDSFQEVEDDDSTYFCKNELGYMLQIRFFDYMKAIEVSIEKDESEEEYAELESDVVEELVESSEENISVEEEGIRTEFKEAMDAYEAFYDEYCEFMKKYEESPTDFSLVMKYAEMMVKLADMDAKFAAWESEDLNDEELKYYLEVNARVSQKLVDAM